MKISYDLNKMFGKRFTDFRSEEFVTIQNIFRSVANKIKISNSSCDIINKTKDRKQIYILSFLADKQDEENLISYIKENLEDGEIYETTEIQTLLFDSKNILSSFSDSKEYTLKVLCTPYIINPVTKEKMDADEFYIYIKCMIFKDKNSIETFVKELKKYYINL